MMTTGKPKNDDRAPPLYEVEEVPVERRLFPRGRRRPGSKEIGQERRRTPGRRKTDREPDTGNS